MLSVSAITNLGNSDVMWSYKASRLLLCRCSLSLVDCDKTSIHLPEIGRLASDSRTYPIPNTMMGSCVLKSTSLSLPQPPVPPSSSSSSCSIMTPPPCHHQQTQVDRSRRLMNDRIPCHSPLVTHTVDALQLICPQTLSILLVPAFHQHWSLSASVSNSLAKHTARRGLILIVIRSHVVSRNKLVDEPHWSGEILPHYPN